MSLIFYTIKPKRKKRRRCIVCRELTHTRVSMNYSWDGETLVEGFHCDKCQKHVKERMPRR